MASFSSVHTFKERNEYSAFTYETDSAVLAIGFGDIGILSEIAEGKYQSKIRLGDGQGWFRLSEKDIAGIRGFLSVCERAGVFSQPLFKRKEAVFSVITRFNPIEQKDQSSTIKQSVPSSQEDITLHEYDTETIDDIANDEDFSIDDVGR